jgi:hypothetical protein
MAARVSPATEEAMRDRPHDHSEKAPVPSKDVFISYARADRDVAQQLAERLRERGLSTWLNAENIRPGMDWSRMERNAVENSRLCIVLVSDKASPSTQPLSAEWTAIQDSAWRRPDLLVCPVVLDNADIPVFLRRWQGIRLSRKEGNIEKAIDGIIEVVGKKAGERTVEISERDTSERAARFSEMIDILTAAQKAASNE